jgi:hypothetical protein
MDLRISSGGPLQIDIVDDALLQLRFDGLAEVELAEEPAGAYRSPTARFCFSE